MNYSIMHIILFDNIGTKKYKHLLKDCIAGFDQLKSLIKAKEFVRYTARKL